MPSVTVRLIYAAALWPLFAPSARPDENPGDDPCRAPSFCSVISSAYVCVGLIRRLLFESCHLVGECRHFNRL